MQGFVWKLTYQNPFLAKYSIQKSCCIEYESIHLICFNCGKYGHAIEFCPKKPPKPMQLGMEINVQGEIIGSNMDIPMNNFLYKN